MLRLRTFGGISLESDAGPLSGAALQRRRLALLALVAVAGERGVSRDKVLAFLYPDADAERARHALAQGLYRLRRDLAEDVILAGTNELRLNGTVLWADVAEFEDAIDRKDLERAAELYAGPFLDGWHLGDAAEFEQWVERERARLAQRAVIALRRLAESATARADHDAAGRWWRRLATIDPFDARAAAGLMAALAGAGDLAGALRHARIYEALVREELDAPPDPTVTALAERLREMADQPPTPAAATLPAASGASSGTRSLGAPSVTATGAAVGGGEAAPTEPHRVDRSSPVSLLSDVPAPPRPTRAARRPLWWAAAASAVLIAGAFAAATARRPQDTVPTLAVGRIQDFTGADSATLSRALGDMLSTNLARIPRVHVVSNARLYEILGQMRGGADDSRAVSAAARRGGATEVVEGALFRHPDGTLRFDLRRVSLTSGAVLGAYSVEGGDPYTLVDGATARLAAALDLKADSLRVADVTTRSLAGYRVYEEGLRAYYQHGDARAALRLFEAALREDSTFAMAAYYAWRSSVHLELPTADAYRSHVLRMADRATDRERLLILTQSNYDMDEPAALDFADTLVSRYPAEPDGHLALGRALVKAGRFADAVPELRRAIAMDSLRVGGVTSRCRACEALGELVAAYRLADSGAAAERVAREYLRASPRSAAPWAMLAGILVPEGRYAEALEARRTVDELSPTSAKDAALWRAELAMRRGDFAEADRALRPLLEEHDLRTRVTALWPQVTSLRYQGRLREARALALEHWRGYTRLDTSATALRGSKLLLAQVLLEAGRPREAAALFDSIAAQPPWQPWQRAKVARHAAWFLTHVATALAAAGDTGRLERLADSVEMLGLRSSYGRDRRLHHYVRGLLLVARGRPAEAEAAFRSAVFSPTFGYTRANLELGRLLLAEHRPAEAAAVLAPALRGALDASNLYVTHTELHELLARAYDEAGASDSAAAHYGWVVNAWRSADSQFLRRRDMAATRLMAIKRVSRGPL